VEAGGRVRGDNSWKQEEDEYEERIRAINDDYARPLLAPSNDTQNAASGKHPGRPCAQAAARALSAYDTCTPHRHTINYTFLVGS
jgi:hypothetical protein